MQIHYKETAEELLKKIVENEEVQIVFDILCCNENGIAVTFAVKYKDKFVKDGNIEFNGLNLTEYSKYGKRN